MRIAGPQATDVGVDLGFGFPEALFTITGDPDAIESSAGRYGDYAAAAAEIGPALTATTVDTWTGDEGERFRARVREYVPMMTTAWRVYSDIVRHLSVFAMTMEQQQSAMRVLRDEAWQVWQQLQAARAAQAQATADHAAAAAAAAAAPLTLDPTAGTELPRAQDTLAEAGVRVTHLEQQWDDCVRRARQIHARMTEAAESATGAIRGLQDPGTVPPPASGGATGTDMPRAVTGSPGADTPGTVGTPSPPSAGPAPSTVTSPRDDDGPPGIPTRFSQGFSDKLFSRREWLKALNLLPSDKLVDYSRPGHLDRRSMGGYALQAVGFTTQYLPMLNIRNDLIHAAKGEANALPRGFVWDRVLNKRLLEADARWQKALVGRYARAGESTLAKAASLVERSAGLASAAERVAQTTTQAVARRLAPLSLSLALHGPMLKDASGIAGQKSATPRATRLRAGHVGRVLASKSQSALDVAYTGLEKTTPVLQAVGQRLGGSASTLQEWAKGVAAAPSTLAGRQVNVLDKLGKVGGRLNVAAGVATGAFEQWKTDSNTDLNTWTRISRSGIRGGLVGGGGWLGGAAVGAAAGSVVPVVGTAVGGIIGGVLGAMAGDAAADAVLQPAS